jgi:hypothetical protein
VRGLAGCRSCSCRRQQGHLRGSGRGGAPRHAAAVSWGRWWSAPHALAMPLARQGNLRPAAARSVAVGQQGATCGASFPRGVARSRARTGAPAGPESGRGCLLPVAPRAAGCPLLPAPAGAATGERAGRGPSPCGRKLGSVVVGQPCSSPGRGASCPRPLAPGADPSTFVSAVATSWIESIESGGGRRGIWRPDGRMGRQRARAGTRNAAS